MDFGCVINKKMSNKKKKQTNRKKNVTIRKSL